MNKHNLKNLYELMEEELHNLNVPEEFCKLNSFITDGKKSALFIRQLLDDESFNIPDERSDLYRIAEMRARHSAVTFLMGLVFRKFAGLFDKIPTIINKDNSFAMQMWLITSLYHDKAYSSEYIKYEYIDYISKFRPFLLTDDNTKFSHIYPDTLAYTYADISNYDRYAVSFHQNKPTNEKRDHGILGGIMMYSELSKRALKQNNDSELPIIKACSLAVAQHNIFKSSNKERDKEYKKYDLNTLLSTSTFKIRHEKALLLFLSLIDTIECVKKFSQSQKSNRYLETLTTLKSIKLSVSEHEILLDLSELSKRINEKYDFELNNMFDNYINVLRTINTWTEIKIADRGANQFAISLGQPLESAENKILVAAI